MSYINNRRCRIFDNNNIDNLRKFIKKKLTYNPNTNTDDELFTFGVEYGRGTDDDHFHCGFTSVRLLEKLNKINSTNGIFHLDATYKIVKYNYSLIVLGFRI